MKERDERVQHPAHYSGRGGVECIEAIKACMSAEAFKGFLKGNILKYLWRYEQKNGVEDLTKAEVYLDWLKTEERMAEPLRTTPEHLVDGEEQVRHGHWEPHPTEELAAEGWVVCSLCKKGANARFITTAFDNGKATEKTYFYNYCPWCGAIMDGGDDE